MVGMIDKLRAFVAGVVPSGYDPGMAERLLTSFHDTERRGLMLACAVRAVIVIALVLLFAVTGSFVGDGWVFLLLMPLGALAKQLVMRMQMPLPD